MNYKLLSLGAVILLGGSAQAASVVPQFTRGTVTSDTTSTTRVVETIHQIEYTTGTSYTVTGTNIRVPSNPSPSSTYSIIDQGAPFQFSEGYLGPGMAAETWIERTTEINARTNSVSVFTQ